MSHQWEAMKFALDRKGTELDLRIITRSDGMSEIEASALLNNLLIFLSSWTGVGTNEADVALGHTGLSNAKWQLVVKDGPYILWDRVGEL